jgi:hypothetical protein
MGRAGFSCSLVNLEPRTVHSSLSENKLNVGLTQDEDETKFPNQKQGQIPTIIMNGIKIGTTKASGHSIGSNIYST